VIDIAHYIDHTILKPTTTYIEINKICKEAIEYGFAAVCVPPPFVRAAFELLTGQPVRKDIGKDGKLQEDVGKATRVRVATVIGFPFGYSVGKAKLAEVEQALADGADELDVVINLIALRNGEWSLLKEEMEMLTGRIHSEGGTQSDTHSDRRIVKVIIESGILQEEEIIRCCEIYSKLGVDFLKTSTGYAEKGATLEAVQLMRRLLPAGIRIKASGGIRTYAFARQLIEAGADRLGCSASVEIVKSQPATTDY
jgi:deoxyribose-phosphate aldolase